MKDVRNQKHFFLLLLCHFFLLCLSVCAKSTCLCMGMCEVQKKISSVLFCHSMPLNVEPGCQQESPSNPPISALQAPVFQRK
ncbi:hypothetical protein LEMLEM_LOCUS8078 [Lemmus lemmus]